MTFNEQDYKRLSRIVQYEARAIVDDTSGIAVEVEDIEQEMWAHLIEKWSYYHNKDDGLIRVAVRKVGRSHCATERYDFMFHSAQYVYTPKEVRALLKEAFFDAEAWTVPPRKDDFLKATVTEEGGGVTVALWDVRSAFDSLRLADQQIIQRAYRDNEQLESSTDRSRLSRAVDTVTRYLNSKVVAGQEARNDFDGGPGARRVITNAHAIAITE